MADLQDYSLTPGASVNVNVPRATITARVIQNGVQIADFTGANALQWPAVWGLLSAAQRLELANMLGPRIVMMRAGLD